MKLKNNITTFLKTHPGELATIVFTDIVDWTKISVGLGDADADLFTNRHRGVIQKLLKKFTTGRIITEEGDSFLIKFGLSSDAVQFALYLQAHLRSLPSLKGFFFRDRVGINSGEVRTELVNGLPNPNQLKGIPVNICRRIMDLAWPDQILMTEAVFEDAFRLFKDKRLSRLAEIVWKSHGFYELKGLEHKKEIFEVGEIGLASFQRPEDGPKGKRILIPAEMRIPASSPQTGDVMTRIFDKEFSSDSIQKLSISAISDQITGVGKAITGIRFTIGAANLDLDVRLASVIARSSNQLLIPNGSIFLSGSGTNRTMTLFPAAGVSGKAVISITVSATGIGSNTIQFSLTVGDPSVRAQLVRDFNRDGFADLILQSSEGRISFWSMNGWNRVALGDFNPSQVGDLGWKVVGVGDFTDCGASDLLFQHEDGTMSVWYLDGPQLIQATLLNPNNAGPGWRVVATGDVNNDGQPDIILQHTDGTIGAWLMSGIDLQKPILFNPNSPGDGWRIVAAGDLQKNDKVDLVFQHTDGSLGAWFLNGLDLKEAYKISLPEGFDPGWRVKAMADLDKDGSLELVVQHTDGRLAAWATDGTIFKSAHPLNPDNPGHGWQLAGPK